MYMISSSSMATVYPSRTAASMAASMFARCSERTAIFVGLIVVLRSVGRTGVEQAVVLMEAEVAVEAVVGLVDLGLHLIIHLLILRPHSGRINGREVDRSGLAGLGVEHGPDADAYRLSRMPELP